MARHCVNGGEALGVGCSAPQVQPVRATTPRRKLLGNVGCFFFFLVSAYSGSYHKFGFEIEALNLANKKQTQQPLPTPHTQPRATHSPAGFSVLKSCQQGLGQTCP